jgi:hypothetical protein
MIVLPCLMCFILTTNLGPIPPSCMPPKFTHQVQDNCFVNYKRYGIYILFIHSIDTMILTIKNYIFIGFYGIFLQQGQNVRRRLPRANGRLATNRLWQIRGRILNYK